MRVNPAVFGIVLVFLLQNCASGPMDRKQTARLNDEFENQVWVTRMDLRVPLATNEGEIVFKKGSRLKIWIVSRGDWVKIKAYPAAENREQARGKTIIFLFDDSMQRELARRRKVNPQASEQKLVLDTVMGRIEALLEKENETEKLKK